MTKRLPHPTEARKDHPEHDIYEFEGVYTDADVSLQLHGNWIEPIDLFVEYFLNLENHEEPTNNQTH